MSCFLEIPNQNLIKGLVFTPLGLGPWWPPKLGPPENFMLLRSPRILGMWHWCFVSWTFSMGSMASIVELEIWGKLKRGSPSEFFVMSLWNQGSLEVYTKSLKRLIWLNLIQITNMPSSKKHSRRLYFQNTMFLLGTRSSTIHDIPMPITQPL